MRWLVGWSSAAGAQRRRLLPVAGQVLWGGPDPLWAVGDWRPDEIRVVQTDEPGGMGRTNGGRRTSYRGPEGRAPGGAYGDAGGSHSSHGFHSSHGDGYGDRYGDSSQGGAGSGPVARLAVVGCCHAGDEDLRAGLFSARGGALRHLTAWPGSYTVVLQIGRRVTVLGDLAGARPVFHTPWADGTAYATAALPLADLTEAALDVTHLAALLACPDAPEAIGDTTPYVGVRRIPPGHALIMREGVPQVAGYEPTASLVVGAPPADADQALAGVRDALVESVRARLATPRYVPDADPDARAVPVPGIGADLSGGSASATLALLAAGLPGMPGTLLGPACDASGVEAGQRLLAVTFNDLAGGGVEPELERARHMAADPRLHHVVVPGGAEELPYADILEDLTLTDEPSPLLVTAQRDRRRLAAGGADHLTGHGARQVIDAHPARLADLLADRRRRHLLRPVAALAKADGPSGRSVLVPFTVYRAARRLARTPYPQGVEDTAGQLLNGRFDDPPAPGDALAASLAALSWCRPGPAARWLTGEALAEVSFLLQEAVARPGPVERPGEHRARAVLARHAADLRVLEQAVQIPSQRLHAPFLDNQVVRACRALPDHLRVQPGARAAVLRGVLAASGIRDLPPGWGAGSHTAAAAATWTGLRAAAGPLLDLFQAPLLADAGLVDVRPVREALRTMAERDSDGAAALPLDGLAEIIAAEVWLRRLLARRGSCWTGADAPRQRAVSGGVVTLTPPTRAPLVPAHRPLPPTAD
jgi:hypothetical protein